MKKTKGKARRALEAKYNFAYEFKNYGGRLKCAYCGDTRECTDHIPALVIVDEVGLDSLHNRGIDLVIVPSCNACNETLGARGLLTYEDRLIFLYHNLINTAEKRISWTDGEINELSGELKRMMKAHRLRMRREIAMRLRGMEEAIGRCDIDL